MYEDFHYYALFVLARHAGLAEPDARTIAYCSQYVDDSTEGDTMLFSNCEASFDPVRSSWTGLESLVPDVQRKIYLPFHFVPPHAVPEHASCRDDTHAYSYLVVPDGKFANQLLDAAIDDRSELRLHKIGVALHGYADTWAHQGFSGRHGPENDLQDISKLDEHGRFRSVGIFGQLLRDIRPDVGHAEAGPLPDLSWLTWSFVQGGRTIVRNNAEIFLAAARACFAKLASAAGGGARPWGAIAGRVAACLAAQPANPDASPGTLLREASMRWIAAFPEYFTGLGLMYSRVTWRADALLTSDLALLDWDMQKRSWGAAGAFAMRPGFHASNWVMFHRAALWHRFVFRDMTMRPGRG